VTFKITQDVLRIFDDLSHHIQQRVTLCDGRETCSMQPLRKTSLASSAQCLGIVQSVANLTDGLLVQADRRVRPGHLLRKNLVAQREHARRDSHHSAQGRQPNA
jgi:hypothetical protein